MELTEQQKQELAEVELCIDRYFDMNVKRVMDGIKAKVNESEVKERSAYQRSAGGVVNMALADPISSMFMQEAYVQTTGEWCSKSSEDYYQLCHDRIHDDKTMQKDLSVLAEAWRTRMIQTIGREAYDEHSRQLGTDLAIAYVGYRMESRMIDHMVHQNVPHSSIQYVVQHGVKDSVFGFMTSSLKSSEMDEMLARKADEMYGPTLLEKGAGKVLGFGVDTISTGGFGSWSGVGKLAIAEAVVQGGETLLEAITAESPEKSIEAYISEGILDSKENVIAEIQERSRQMDVNDHSFSQELNESLGGRLYIMDEELSKRLNYYATMGLEVANRYKEMTYHEEPQEQVRIPYKVGYVPEPEPEEEVVVTEGNTPAATMELCSAEPQTPVIHDQEMKPIETETRAPAQSVSGWGGVLTSLGLNDMGSVGRNLGYVIAMLPDLMMGLFTGKTNALGLAKDNMLPLASILMGLFVKNPLLKIALIGMGGMNLLNKAGHEAIDRKHAEDVVAAGRSSVQYRRYEDQPLNSRIKNPEIHGHLLFATVDGIPQTIQLPRKTVEAYEAGVLPLNTLANAVLAKSDEMNQVAHNQYETAQEQTRIQRGIS